MSGWHHYKPLPYVEIEEGQLKAVYVLYIQVPSIAQTARRGDRRTNRVSCRCIMIDDLNKIKWIAASLLKMSSSGYVRSMVSSRA